MKRSIGSGNEALSGMLQLLIMTGILCLCGVMLTGCAQRNRVYSEEEVRQVVLPGVSQKTVEEALGKPLLVTKEPDGTTMAMYSNSDNVSAEFRDRFVGFIVYYTNGNVQLWTSAYGDRSTITSQGNSSSAIVPHGGPPGGLTNAIAAIAFYIVSDSEFAGGVPASTASEPNIGYIHEKPELVITNIGQIDKVSDRGPALLIQLGSDDAKRFAELTRKCLGARLLAVVEGEAMAAPYVTMPITTATFTIPCRDEAQQENLFQNLQRSAKQL